MPTIPADDSALQRLLPLLRQLREIRELREARPGVFQLRGNVFIQFHDDAGALVAELKRARGGFDRYPVDSPTGQRKLFDDAKRRAATGTGTDDD